MQSWFFPSDRKLYSMCTFTTMCTIINFIEQTWDYVMHFLAKLDKLLKKWPRRKHTTHKYFFHVLLSLQRFIQLSWGKDFSHTKKIISVDFQQVLKLVWYNQSTKRRNNNLPTKNTLPILKLSFRNEEWDKEFPKQAKLRVHY